MSPEAVREAGDGTHVDIDVHPNARETRVRDGKPSGRGTIGIDVAARPEQGAANRALCVYLERLCGPEVRVFVVRGLTSRRKTVLVLGTTKERVAKALKGGRR